MTGPVIATPVVEILGDDHPLRAALTRAQAALKTFGGRAVELGRRGAGVFGGITAGAITARGAFAALAGAAGATLAAKKIFDVGAAVEETASKFRTVLGPSTADAQRFLDQFATTAGLTNREGQDLIATTAAIAQGMGFSQVASSGFAQEVARLAGDLSSFNNIPIADTSRAIQAALTGERESLKRLGVVILETDVQKRALLNTGKARVDQLTQEEKATASLQLITERAGAAVGDLERTKDSAANRARKLGAEFLNLRDAAAYALLPALGEVLGTLAGGTGTFKTLGDTMVANAGVFQSWARVVIEAAQFAAKALALPFQIAFNIGQLLGEMAVPLLKFATGDRIGAATEAIKRFGSAKSEITDMKDAAFGLVDQFDDLRLAAGKAWGTIANPPVPDTPVVERPTLTTAVGLSETESALAEIRKELAATLVQSEQLSAILGAQFDLPKAQADAYRTAIEKATEAQLALGTVIGPQGQSVEQLARDYLNLQFAIDETAAAAGRYNTMWERLIALAKANQSAGASLTEALLSPQERYNAAIAEADRLLAAKVITDETHTRAVREAAKALEAATTKTTVLAQETVSLAEIGGSAIADFALGAGDAFHDFVQRAMRDLARLLARILVINLLKKAFEGSTGGFGKGVLEALDIAGARAEGGPVLRNRTYLVGERGPELFVPSTAGDIHATGTFGAGGMAADADAIADRILDTIGPPPRWLPPEMVAREDYWRRLTREGLRLAAADGAL